MKCSKMAKKEYRKPSTANRAVFANMDAMMPIIEERLASGQSVELSPRGISMLPLIREGQDSVILSPVGERLKSYDLPLYKRENGGYVLHRVVKACDGVYTMAGDNQYIYEAGIKHSQIIAVVTAIRRGGRLIDAESTLYRFYAMAWHRSRGARYFIFRVKRKLKRIFKK